MRIFIIAVLFLVSNINYAQIKNDTIKLNRLLKELEINASLADKKPLFLLLTSKKLKLIKLILVKTFPIL